MNERLREALRRKIAAHNRLVVLTSICGVLAVAVMWAGLYLVSRWCVVMSATLVDGVEATMPPRFDRAFAVGVLVLLVAGWIARRFGLYQRLREEKGVGFTLIEVCLIPARATFGTISNLQNYLRLGEDDLRAATDFLVRVARAGKLAATAVPVELPDESTRDRVLYALQLLDLIYLRRGNPDPVYAVLDPQRLLPFLTNSVPTRPAA